MRGTLPLMMVKPEAYAVLAGWMARPALMGQAITPLGVGYVFATLTGPKATLWLLCTLAVINLLLVVALKKRLPAPAPSVR